MVKFASLRFKGIAGRSNNEYRISNVEGRNPIDFYGFKRQSGAILPFEILRFDIRNSAVRFSPQVRQTKW
jgi:hypothetical protein